MSSTPIDRMHAKLRQSEETKAKGMAIMLRDAIRTFYANQATGRIATGYELACLQNAIKALDAISK